MNSITQIWKPHFASLRNISITLQSLDLNNKLRCNRSTLLCLSTWSVKCFMEVESLTIWIENYSLLSVNNISKTVSLTLVNTFSSVTRAKTKTHSNTKCLPILLCRFLSITNTSIVFLLLILHRYLVSIQTQTSRSEWRNLLIWSPLSCKLDPRKHQLVEVKLDKKLWKKNLWTYFLRCLWTIMKMKLDSWLKN